MCKRGSGKAIGISFSPFIEKSSVKVLADLVSGRASRHIWCLAGFAGRFGVWQHPQTCLVPGRGYSLAGHGVFCVLTDGKGESLPPGSCSW